MKEQKHNEIYALIGKIVVGIIVLIIALPWVFSEIGHIKFKGPEGQSYYLKQDAELGATRYMVVSFHDNSTMSIYNLEENMFSEIAGVQVKYNYSGNSYMHIGPVFMSSNPTLLFWNNYELHNQYTLDKAIVKTIPIEVRSVNVSEIGTFDYDRVNTSTISIRTKSIKIDDTEFKLVEEENYPVSSVIRRFDENSEVEWRHE